MDRISDDTGSGTCKDYELLGVTYNQLVMIYLYETLSQGSLSR